MRYLPQHTLRRHRGLTLSVVVALSLVLLAGLCWAAAGPMHAVGASATDGYTTYYVEPNENCGGVEPCYRTIQAAVDAVDEATDVIKVAGGTYSGVITRGSWRQVVLILRPLTLRGGYSRTNWSTPNPANNPTIVDANGGGRVVVIESIPSLEPVTLEGLTIANGSATGLGGYSVQSIPLGDAGGGIYIHNAAATIKNCELHHNTATDSTYTSGFGGAIFVYSGTVTIQDNLIHDNTASSHYSGIGGGIALVYSPKTSTIAGNVLRNNAASLTGRGSGGGVYLLSSQANLSGNTLQDNVAGSAEDGRGGGLYSLDSGITVTANQFRSNTANTATNDGFGLGGGLYIERYDWSNKTTTEAITMTGNTIESNTAARSGKGIGGGALLRITIGTVSGNTFRGNVAGLAEGSGGGLFLGPSRALTRTTASRITVSGNTIQENRAGTGGVGRGGGLYVGSLPPVGSTWDTIPGATVAGNTVVSNTASSSGLGKGGGVFLASGTSSLSTTQNTIRGNLASNQAQGYGGGVYMETTNASLTGNTIQSNTASSSADGYGGGVYLESGSATFMGNTIQGNTASSRASGRGGGMGFHYSFPVLSGNRVLSNTASTSASGWGGGLYASLTEVNSTYDTFRGNNASVSGGGQGGGLALESCDLFVMRQGTIVQNAASLSTVAASEGGGLYAVNSAPLFLTNNIIGANTARTEGSGLWLDGYGIASLVHTTIAYNAGSGRGLYGSGDLTIVCTNTIVAGHTQVGVFVEDGVAITLANTLWSGNGANTGGAGSIHHTADFSGNPGFVAPGNGDFHLGPCSAAAIDKGVNAGVTIDIDDDARPYGGGYDLGADEYVGIVAQCQYLYVPFLRK